MADQQRSAFHGLILKLVIRRINRGLVPEILWCTDFGVLAWNCLFIIIIIIVVLGSFWGISSWPPKGTSLGGNTLFEPFSVRISATVQLGRVTEKKIHDNKKVTKVLYFPYLGRSPHWTDTTQKLHGGWCPGRNHVSQVSNWNFHGLRFYSGSNFRFSYWFLHGPYDSKTSAG